MEIDVDFLSSSNLNMTVRIVRKLNIDIFCCCWNELFYNIDCFTRLHSQGHFNVIQFSYI